MKIDLAALCALVGICAAVALPVPLAAQQEIVSYVGELSGSCPSMRGDSMQIDIQGDELKATRKGADGSARFEGKLQGSSFEIIRTTKQGNTTEIRGSVEADSIRLTLQQRNCRYSAVLKKM